jgi:hypothetical protein
MTKREMLNILIVKEQINYIAEMLTKTPEERIGRAHEICYREELVDILTTMPFDDAQLDFLLTLPNPVGFMYSEWLKTDMSVCKMLVDTVRDVLNEEADNPCDSCNKDICYGCPHTNE